MTSMQQSKPSLNPALKPFWRTRARNKVLYGGRSSSKSWDAAGMAICISNMVKVRVLCCRQIQNKIEESVYALLKIQIDRFGLAGRFRVLENKIINTVTGSEFIFYGLWRHIGEIKSLESVDVLWLEEAHALTSAQWEILEPTIRKEGSECWFIFNPGLVTDFVWRNFVVSPPPDTIIRRINYDENPFLSSTIKKVIAAAKDRDPDAFDHIYGGVPRTDDDSAVIKLSWIEAAVDAHKKLGIAPAGEKRLGFDIADSGADKCATVYAHGSVAFECAEWAAQEDELLKSCTLAYTSARKYGATITYDCIGVGASAGAKFGELNESSPVNVMYNKFNAGDKVLDPDDDYQPNITNKDFFSNLKAQAWWMVADRFRNTFNAVTRGEVYPDDELISIDSSFPNLERLKFELSIPKRDFDKNGRVKVESKEDLKKRDIPSPNIADAFIMAFAPVDSAMAAWAKLGS
ncbi:TPA: PBSX family phage terminase large subunit [Escherichia coli]|uniref:PBSX family phage terminase large subunit n=1 Tax=Hafnia paralvei TaxID=546367 RepID=UPI001AFE05B5|nr:PBSX family phage terminase large subunit [Hafnia paralvei]MBU2672618.1 PBSX family phage terminase large subunit [Hafnia paralvei]HBA3651383.1 PBSX family phage terminase large subunit [Escherichia coli]